jgi:hypothetical protein
VTIPAGVGSHVLSTHTITGLVADSGGILQWHINGALMTQLLGDTKFTAATTVDYAAGWVPVGGGSGWNTDTAWSQIMFTSEDYMTYGLAVLNLELSGAGADATQDTGVYTDVNELVEDRTTGMTFDTVGDHFSGALADIAGISSGSPIMGFRVAADVRRGASGPSQVKLYVVIGGTRYYSPAIAVNGVGFVTVAYQWDLNPATSAPWTVTQINGLEIGVEAA